MYVCLPALYWYRARRSVTYMFVSDPANARSPPCNYYEPWTRALWTPCTYITPLRSSNATLHFTIIYILLFNNIEIQWCNWHANLNIMFRCWTNCFAEPNAKLWLWLKKSCLLFLPFWMKWKMYRIVLPYQKINIQALNYDF